MLLPVPLQLAPLNHRSPTPSPELSVAHDRNGRLVAFACSALVLALAACGGSSNTVTGPQTPTPAQLASFFDSIYAATIAAGTSADSALALNVVYLLESTPAYGGSRSTFVVTTATENQTWYGFTYEYINVDGDSGFETIAYSDNSLTNVLATGVNYSNSDADTSTFADLYQDQFATRTDDSAATYTASVTSGGTSCGLQSGLAAETLLAEYANGYACTDGTYQVSAAAAYAGGAGLGALETWSISGVSFAGPIFTEDGASRVTVPSRIAAILERLRVRQHPGATLPRAAHGLP
jgi:hypothetical protein